MITDVPAPTPFNELTQLGVGPQVIAGLILGLPAGAGGFLVARSGLTDSAARVVAAVVGGLALAAALLLMVTGGLNLVVPAFLFALGCQIGVVIGIVRSRHRPPTP